MTIPGVYVLSAALGFANAGRHRVCGYRTPRPREATTPDAQYAVAVVDAWEHHGATWDGKRVLELGPGGSLATGRLILERGATAYIAVDCVRLVGRPEIPYLVTDYPAMRNVSGVFDVIVSHAALEHFHDVAATFRRLSELAVPGCVMVHHVDAKTHMRWVRDKDPLNLLRYPDWLYRMMSFPGIPNRLRASEYVTAAEAAGFAADCVPVALADPDYVARFKAWRDYTREDLAALSFVLRGVRV